MPLDIIIGAQWGDEGKGRIVDLMAAEADLVARFNGGDNAGHTVKVGSQTFKLHLIPSGIVHPHTFGVLGNGMVINPVTFLKEIESLRASGIEINPQRLQISFAAHLITPGHRALDLAQEKSLGKDQIGTTGRGIGPAYTDKTARRGLRALDMLDPVGFKEKMLAHIASVNQTLKALYQAEPLDAQAIADEYAGYVQIMAPYISDTSILLDSALKAGQRVLAEGAQGTLLDLDYGTYPFVTSSNVTAAGVFAGLGLGICPIERVVGVTKAFQTRVGSGPFPTEVFEKDAERLRGTGTNPWDEFGTTTGRPRRVGWLDGVLLRYAVRLNGLTELVLTKLDVLSGLKDLRICTAYQSQGKTYSDLPMGPTELNVFEPIYTTLPGWDMDLTGVRNWNELPDNTQGYIRKIEQIAGVPVSFSSVGPERDQVVKVQK
jgi:adenylosuccinate synthase